MWFVPRYEVCVFLLFFVNVDIWAAELEVLPLADYFKDCKLGKPEFDNCIKNALNAARPLFVPGVPEYGIKSFDPHFIKAVSQTLGSPRANFTIRLSNVLESDWTISEVTKFESDLPNFLIRYQQVFPDKRVTGNYELLINLAGFSYGTKGDFNFRFFDWIQTMTVTRPPTITNGLTSPGRIKVDVNNTDIGYVSWHFSNLLRGKGLPETFADQFLNYYWRPLFDLARPILNAVASQGFTDIYNDSFANFPFDTFFLQLEDLTVIKDPIPTLQSPRLRTCMCDKIPGSFPIILHTGCQVMCNLIAEQFSEARVAPHGRFQRNSSRDVPVPVDGLD